MWAVHGPEEVPFLLVFHHRRKLAVAVIGIVTARLEELQASDMWCMDRLISAKKLLLLEEIHQCLSEDRAFREPQRKP